MSFGQFGGICNSDRISGTELCHKLQRVDAIGLIMGQNITSSQTKLLAEEQNTL